MTAHRLTVVYASAVILSACSLVYELLIAQTMSTLAANTVVWYSVTVGVYLAAMGIGATFYDPRPERNTWSVLFQLELLLTAVGASAVAIVHVGHMLYLYLFMHDAELAGTTVFFSLAFLATFVVGLLTGIELPLLIRLGNKVAQGPRITNRVLAADYSGALVGGLFFPLVLVPRLSLQTIGLLTATINWTVALVVLGSTKERPKPLVPSIGAAGLLGILLLVGFLNLGGIQQYFLQKYYYYHTSSESPRALFRPMKEMPTVFRRSSAYQKIDLVYDSIGDPGDVLVHAFSTKFRTYPEVPNNRYLFLNGEFQVVSNWEELYHEFFAHVPIILHRRVPERILVLGAGDGLLVRELLKYDGVRQIVHVDLDPVLVDLARTHPVLTAMNRHALDDPRVETVIGDAFQYVRQNRSTFDAIYLDFPYANDYNVSKLYSREFFTFVNQRLEVGGYAVLDAPGIDGFEPDGQGSIRAGPTNDWDVYYHTLKKAGFATVHPYVAALEIDNVAAYQVLNQVWPDEPQGEAAKRTAIIDFIQRHSQDLWQGFIAVWKGEHALDPEFRSPGIELHVLNEKRYRLAFRLPFPMSEEVDEHKVNSIMRPTLPSLSPWHVRRPW